MKALDKIKQIWESFNDLEGNLFRNSLAFSFLLALAPALTFIVMAFSYGSLDLGPVISALHGFLPEELIDPLISYLTNQDYGTTISTIIAMVTALWLASGGITSFVQIAAQKENIDYSGLVIKYKSLVLFVLLILTIGGLIFIFSLTSWDVFFAGPILLGVLYYALYRFLTFEKKEWSYGLPGTVVATLATVIFAWLFVSILRQFWMASYQVSYGPFASIVLLLLSFYVLASIIYLGYCVNEVLKKKKEPSEIVYKRILLQELIEKIKEKFFKKEVS